MLKIAHAISLTYYCVYKKSKKDFWFPQLAYIGYLVNYTVMDTKNIALWFQFVHGIRICDRA